MVRFFIAILALAGIACGGAWAKPLIIYTAAGATTAQAPLFAALAAGWQRDEPPALRTWAELGDQEKIVRAGQGDVWVGHLDGFARAARDGAPAVLLAVTAWSGKFRFLTTDATVSDLAALAVLLRSSGDSLAVVPPGSPAQGLWGAARPGFFGTAEIGLTPRQAVAALARGAIRHVAAPEPLASVLAARFPGLRDIGGLGDLVKPKHDLGYGWPMAGIAVNRVLLSKHPGIVRDLLDKMTAWAAAKANDPAAVVAALPRETVKALGQTAIRASLARDPMEVVPASSARPLIIETMEVFGGPVPEGFLPR